MQPFALVFQEKHRRHLHSSASLHWRERELVCQAQLFEFLSKLNENYHGSRDNLFATFARVSEDPAGPGRLPPDISHYVHQKGKIWEFIAGDIRVLWFYSPSERRTIICVHALLKKSQKTKRSDIEKALRAKNKYMQDLANGQVRILEE